MTDRGLVRRRRTRARIAAVTAATGLAAFAGWVGFTSFPSLVSRGDAVHISVVATVAGIASFFSPCSFPLLVTFFGRRVTGPTRGEQWRRAFAFAGAASLGSAAFVLGVGLLLAVGLGGLAAQVTFGSTGGRLLRFLAGATLIAVALRQLGVFRWSMPGWLTPSQGRSGQSDRQTLGKDVAFGAGYLVAGFG